MNEASGEATQPTRTVNAIGRPYDLTGMKFGRLTVASEAPQTNGEKRWNCVCECGGKKSVNSYNLRKGQVRSCGCLSLENVRTVNRTHGLTYAPIWKRWKSMRERCERPKNPGFKNYGGRGITVCDRWKKFANFLADMGFPPQGMTIERKDNNGNYDPDNCVWATRKHQQRNRRCTRFLTVNGETKPLIEWAEIGGMSNALLRSRIFKRHMTPEAAISTPVEHRRRQKPRTPQP